MLMWSIRRHGDSGRHEFHVVGVLSQPKHKVPTGLKPQFSEILSLHSDQHPEGRLVPQWLCCGFPVLRIRILMPYACWSYNPIIKCEAVKQ